MTPLDIYDEREEEIDDHSDEDGDGDMYSGLDDEEYDDVDEDDDRQLTPRSGRPSAQATSPALRRTPRRGPRPARPGARGRLAASEVRSWAVVRAPTIGADHSRPVAHPGQRDLGGADAKALGGDASASTMPALRSSR